jgi:hypothetical protein
MQTATEILRWVVQPLINNVSGDGNTAIGVQAGVDITGDGDTCLGTSSGFNITTGNNINAIGVVGGTSTNLGQLDNSCYIDNILERE